MGRMRFTRTVAPTAESGKRLADLEAENAKLLELMSEMKRENGELLAEVERLKESGEEQANALIELHGEIATLKAPKPRRGRPPGSGKKKPAGDFLGE